MSELSSAIIASGQGAMGTVLHLGAGTCDEMEDYLHLKAGRIVLVEPNSELLERLRKTWAGVRFEVIDAAVAAIPSDSRTLWVLNNPRESSLLLPEHLLRRFPNLRVERKIPVKCISLGDLLGRAAPDPARDNLLVVEIQGMELAVLSSITRDALQRFSWILVRASTEVFYEGGASAEAVDDFLSKAGFKAGGQARKNLPNLPFQRKLYFRHPIEAQIDAMAQRLDEQVRATEALQKQKVELETEMSKLSSAHEDQRADWARRQRLLDEEMLKAEAQIELIKDVLLRDKAF